MTRQLALFAAFAAFTAVAAFAWAEPARAFHDMECPAFRGTRIDPTTGEKRCGAITTEARRQAVRTRQLFKEQQRRTQTSAEIIRQRDRPRLLLQEQQRRTRSLEVQQRTQSEALGHITDIEIGRQQLTIQRTAAKQKQPGLDLRQSISQQEILNIQAAAEKQRRERSRIDGLERQRNLLEQDVRLMKTDLLEDQKLKTRILQKKQQRR